MSDCLFCHIIDGSIPCEKVYEDDQLLAFKDIHPKAPVHVLVIPKQHIDSLADLDNKHQALMGYLTCRLPEIARQAGLNNGFKTQIHTGKAAGQEVFHLHYHLLGAPA